MLSHMVKSQYDPDMQETFDLLRQSEERCIEQGFAKMKVLHTRYKQAEQTGDTLLAKKLRREYYQEFYITIISACSYRDLLFPDPKLQTMLDKISQEAGL